MFSSFSAKGFRGLGEVDVDLKRINLILGKNNSGKTALLEAIYLLIGTHTPELTLRLRHFRGDESPVIDPQEIWGWLFPFKDTSKTIKLKSTDEKQVSHTLAISFKPMDSVELPSPAHNGSSSESPSILSTIPHKGYKLAYNYLDSNKQNFEVTARLERSKDKVRVVIEPPIDPIFGNGHYLCPYNFAASEIPGMYSKLLDRGQDKHLLKAVQALEPGAVGLFLWSGAGVPELRVRFENGKNLPVVYCGAGAASWITILLSIIDVPGGIVLIDEIDAGFHYSVMKDIWPIINQVSKENNTQLIITTHDYDCIRYAVNSIAEEDRDDLAVYRLEKEDEKTQAILLGVDGLEVAMRENMEVR